MTDDTSLLARKLRDYRASNGRHGRMTQEELADLLGVSVDAVSKYERSVSFLRGDLEHRLSERLGWSRDEVRACREDWDVRQRRPRDQRYRLLDDELIDRHFGGSFAAAARAAVEFSGQQLPALPTAFEANPDVFAPIHEAMPDHRVEVLCDGRIVATWFLPFILPDDVVRFRAGRLLESDLSPDRTHRPILPGHYYGYCPALVVAPGHEAASTLLFSSFVAFLERLAERDVLLYGIGTTSVTPAGVQVCRDLGMTRLCDHVLGPDFGIWELPGSAIPASIFGRRSLVLRRRYADAFPA